MPEDVVGVLGSLPGSRHLHPNRSLQRTSLGISNLLLLMRLQLDNEENKIYDNYG